MTHTSRLRAEPLEDRLAPAAGSLDPSFAAGGIQRFTSGVVSELAAVPDGRILALVGPANGLGPRSLARFGPDGTPDPTFGTGGVVSLPGSTSPSVLTPLPDGGAVVGWVFNDGIGNTLDFALVRVTATGAIDPTFGTGGTAVVSTPGGSDTADLAAVVVQPDGRILLAGDQTADRIILGQPPRYFQGVVARLTATGQPDPSFGAGGVAVVTDPTGTFTSLIESGLALQPDGRIVLAGAGSATAVGVRPQVYAPVAVRLTADGRPDPTFGAGGWVQVAFSLPNFSNGFTAVSVLPDGRVLLAGAVTAGNGIAGGAARLTAAGQLDPGYGTGGLAETAQFATGFDRSSIAAIDPSGRVVFDTTSDTIYRLAVNGEPDAGFGTNGRVIASDLPGLNTIGTSDLDLTPGLVVLPNGGVLLGGTDHATQVGTTNGLLVRLIGSNPPAGFVPAAPGTVTVGGAMNGTVQVLNPTGGTYTTAGTVAAFPGITGNVRSTTADVNGDGVPDYIVGAGPGGRPQITVFDGKTGETVADFPAFEASFTGGVFVAAADLDGDGKAEIVVTPDQGGSGRVVVFSVAPGGAAAQRASFFGIDDPNFRGGARVAAGDVNRDGTPDLVVAAGFQGGPRTAIFNGTTLFGTPARLLGDFFAFPGSDAVNLRNGVFVAAGDVNGDGFADLVFGGGPGGAPRVFVLSGALASAGNVAGAQAAPLANFFVAGNASDRGGVRLAVKDADGDGRADLTVGSGEGSAARVRVYLGKNFAGVGEPGTFQDISVFGGGALAGGVFVG